MGYAQSGGLLEFFQPNGAGAIGVVDIGAASGTHGEYICIKPCSVKRLLFVVTDEAVVGTSTAPTVVFKKRPTPKSSSGQSTIGTLTIPDASAAGKVIYKEVQVDFAVGDSIEISWTVGTGGSVAGQGVAAVEAFFDEEYVGNNSDMTASA
jgi:hypothetical protein